MMLLYDGAAMSKNSYDRRSVQFTFDDYFTQSRITIGHSSQTVNTVYCYCTFEDNLIADSIFVM